MWKKKNNCTSEPSRPSPLPLDWQAALNEHDRWLRKVVYSRLREPEAVEEVMQEAAQHVMELSDPEPSGEQSPLEVPRQTSRRTAKHDPARRNRLSIHWPGALALSALFLLAFGVGTFLPSPWGRSTPQTAQQAITPQQLVDTGGPATQKPNGSGNANQPVDSQDLLLGNLTLVDNSGGQFEVPVYDWNPQVADELMFRSQALSPEFFQQLKRHRVRSHQSYLPVKLQDGRQVVVPIQELEIVPVGGTAY